MRIILALWFLTISFFLHGQTQSIKKSPPLHEATPAEAGISEERLQWLENMLMRSISQGEIPGVAALIARNGKIVYHKAFGTANAETKEVLRTDHIFRLASQTKAITSTAVMMLWEEGKFRLDDPISKFIPEFRNPRVLQSFTYADTTYTTRPADSEITIRHLLTHTSGVGYGAIDSDERIKMIYEKAGIVELFTEDDIQIGDVIKKLGSLPLHHHPGEKFTYSMGLDVLGYLIEIISGLPFDQFLKEKIFDPLGMKDTYFYLPEDKAGRLVSVQYNTNGAWKNFSSPSFEVNYPVKGHKRFFAGGAGLSGTMGDYASFLQMYLNGGELNGVRILSRTTIESMMANQTGDLFGGGDQYHGLAFGVLTPEGKAKGGLGSIGTFVWGGYFNTSYFADPSEKMIGIIMKQTQGPTKDQTSWKFKQIAGALIDD